VENAAADDGDLLDVGVDDHLLHAADRSLPLRRLVRAHLTDGVRLLAMEARAGLGLRNDGNLLDRYRLLLSENLSFSQKRYGLNLWTLSGSARIFRQKASARIENPIFHTFVAFASLIVNESYISVSMKSVPRQRVSTGSVELIQILLTLTSVRISYINR
jgi:hypothetical protein